MNLASLKPYLYRIGLALSPSLLFRVQHYRVHRKLGQHTYWANLSDPKTFNEFMLRSKLDQDHAGLEHLVDKHEAKIWVEQRVGTEYLIPTLGIYNKAEDLLGNLNAFPCVIKPTHLSGRVCFVRSRKDFERTKGSLHEELNKWLEANFYYESGEIQYKDIEPRLIVEPDLTADSSLLSDYKFFCFHGEPRFIQVDTGRHQGHQRFFMDLEWSRLTLSKGDFRKIPPASVSPPDPPSELREMISIAKSLSREFRFVRVDLYQTNCDIKFGEMTFHPGSGTGPFDSLESDLEAGNMLSSLKELA